MSHKFKNLHQGYNNENSPTGERLRIFVRKNRKMILLFLGTVTVVGIGFLVLIIYFGFQLLQKATQIISRSGEVVTQNQDIISQIIQWGLSMFRQWGFLLGG